MLVEVEDGVEDEDVVEDEVVSGCWVVVVIIWGCWLVVVVVVVLCGREVL